MSGHVGSTLLKSTKTGTNAMLPTEQSIFNETDWGTFGNSMGWSWSSSTSLKFYLCNCSFKTTRVTRSSNFQPCIFTNRAFLNPEVECMWHNNRYMVGVGGGSFQTSPICEYYCIGSDMEKTFTFTRGLEMCAWSCAPISKLTDGSVKTNVICSFSLWSACCMSGEDSYWIGSS